MERPARWAHIGLVAAQIPPHSAYVREILAHAGLQARDVPYEELNQNLPGLGILITVNQAFRGQEAERVGDWVAHGGALIAIGDCEGLETILGVTRETRAYGQAVPLGEGYLEATLSHPLTAHLSRPVRFFGGIALQSNLGAPLARALNAHKEPTNRHLVAENRIQKGVAITLAVDLPASVIRTQQGAYVDQDTPPANDGTANTNDGVLRAEDSHVLDWELDRAPLEPGQPALFDTPAADHLKEILIRSVLYAANETKTALPCVWYYPRQLNGLGHVSVDTEGGDPSEAQNLLHTLRMVGIRGTWHVNYPGFSLDVYRNLRKLEHEVGLLFDSQEKNGWTGDRLRVQLTQLERASAIPDMTSNQNMHARWQGRNDFYQWCEDAGIRVDESRGPTQPGAAGFLFGTCHPFFPADTDGTTIRCLEIPFLAQDPGLFLDSDTSNALMERAAANHGVAHFQVSIRNSHEKALQETLRRIAAEGRNQKLEWWKADEIFRWERARRRLRTQVRETANGGLTLVFIAEEELEDASLLFLAEPGATVTSRGKTIPSKRIERYGFEFVAITFTLPARSPLELTLMPAGANLRAPAA